MGGIDRAGRRRRGLIAGTLMAALAAAGMSGAGAASAESLTKTGAPARTVATASSPAWKVAYQPSAHEYDALTSVSCVGSLCGVAAYWGPAMEQKYGYAGFLSGNRIVHSVDGWDGGEISSGMTGISCVSRTFCMAIGSHVQDATDAEVFEWYIWNGRSWSSHSKTMSEVPEHLSCTSALNCVAVSSHATVALRWTGKSWVSMPELPPGTGSAISCAGSRCLVVGDGEAAWWQGKSWKKVTLPAQKGQSLSVGKSVSCPTTTSCMVVGQGENGRSDDEYSYAASWTAAGGWRTVPVETGPYKRNRFSLNGVSCTSTQSCTAVGTPDDNFTTPWRNRRPVVLHLARDGWFRFDQAPVTADPGLDEVSCTSNGCVAVGTSDDLVEPFGSREYALRRA